MDIAATAAAVRRKKNTEYVRRRRNAETDEQRKVRLAADVAAKRAKVASETEEERKARLARCAESARRRRAIRRQKNTECVRRIRSAETAEQQKARRAADAAAKRRKVASENAEERRARLARCAESARRRRARNAELLACGAAAKRAHRASARRRADPQVVAQHKLYAQVRKAEAAAVRARPQADKFGVRTTPWDAPCPHATPTQTSVERLGRSVVGGVHRVHSVPTEDTSPQAAEEFQVWWSEEDESKDTVKSDDDMTLGDAEQERDDTAEVELRQHWAKK